jgi:hypothetical protein
LAVLLMVVFGGCVIRPAGTVRVTAGGPPVMAAPLSGPGGSASGVISYPGHRVRYPLTIPYPQTINIYVAGAGLDPTVSVYDSYGNRIGFNDDGGSGLDSHLVLTLAPGSYTVEVAGYSSSTGGYTLTVQ